PAEAKASRGPARYGASVRGRWKWHSWALAKPCAASCPGSSSRSSPSLLGFSVSTPDGAEPGATKRPMVRNNEQVWTALVGSRGMASPVSERRRVTSDHHGAPRLSRPLQHRRPPSPRGADHGELRRAAQRLDRQRALHQLALCEGEAPAHAGQAPVGQRRGAPGAVDPCGEGRDRGLDGAAVLAEQHHVIGAGVTLAHGGEVPPHGGLVAAKAAGEGGAFGVECEPDRPGSRCERTGGDLEGSIA